MLAINSSANERNSMYEKSTSTLVNIISKHCDGLRVCYLNARSLNVCKLDYLKFLFSGSCVDVICVSDLKTK